MALVVFLAIIAVEAAILIPSYRHYEADRLDRLAFAGKSALTAMLRDTARHEGPADLSAAHAMAAAKDTPLRGAVLFDAAGNRIAAFGETPALDIAPGTPGTPLPAAQRSVDGRRYDVLWPPEATGRPYTIVARLDSSSVAGDLRAFLLRIAGLVLVISVSVAATTMVILGQWVLAPMLLIRERLGAAAENPAEADRFALEPGPRNEMGEVIESLNEMLRQVAGSIAESSRRQAMLDELNQSLEERVRKRTQQLEKSIENREKTYLELRQSEARFRSIFDGSSDAIFLIDVARGRLIDANEEACRMLGYTREEMRALKIDAIHPNEVEELGRFAAEVAAKGRGRIDTLSCRAKNGREIPVELSASIITLGGRPVMLAIGRDATERRRVERALTSAKEAAEAANRAKTEFLANMSHELRTPLNAIIGFSEVMQNELFGPLGAPRYHAYATDIVNSGRHLLDIINDILDVSKAEAGQIELVEEEVDLREIVAASLRLVARRAEEGRVTLRERLAEGLPRIRADRRKMKQIIVNLLSNAVKFTPPGGHVTLEAGAAPSGAPYIAVIDTGIGIAAEDLDRVLSPFGQVESAFHRNYEGTGLGLPLTKSLVELHRGRLILDSAPGLGTRVTVHLPIERLASATAPLRRSRA